MLRFSSADCSSYNSFLFPDVVGAFKMTEITSLASSLVDENRDILENVGSVNPAHEALSNPEFETPTQLSTAGEETKLPELQVTNIQLEDGEEDNSDEWWNYVHSMVKKDEAEAPENNKNNNDDDIIPAR